METTRSHFGRSGRRGCGRWSQPRIVTLGVASDSHFGDQVADQSGGYLRGSHRMVNHALR